MFTKDDMMLTEAGQLIAAIENNFVFSAFDRRVTTELRRLHETNQALLEALASIAALAVGEGDVCEIIAKRARDTIAKSTVDKK